MQTSRRNAIIIITWLFVLVCAIVYVSPPFEPEYYLAGHQLVVVVNRKTRYYTVKWGSASPHDDVTALL